MKQIKKKPRSSPLIFLKTTGILQGDRKEMNRAQIDFIIKTTRLGASCRMESSSQLQLVLGEKYRKRIGFILHR